MEEAQESKQRHFSAEPITNTDVAAHMPLPWSRLSLKRRRLKVNSSALDSITFSPAVQQDLRTTFKMLSRIEYIKHNYRASISPL